MRILLLTHSFNSLAQRIHVELEARGHELSVELDINDEVTADAVARFRPAVVLAPMLKRRIPEAIWRQVPCLILHPGVPGDRGPAALDWALMRGEREWGVTVLQADAELDAGPLWAAEPFVMAPVRKSTLYRHELTEAAVTAMLRAIDRVGRGDAPLSVPMDERGGWRGPMTQAQRHIDWRRDDTATVVRKIRAADGSPGVLDRIGDVECRLYDAHPASGLSGTPGELLGRGEEAICRATADGAVWIGQLGVSAGALTGLKLPAVQVLGEHCPDWPTVPAGSRECNLGYPEIEYSERGGVGYLAFDFYNGAMSTERCQRLLAAYRRALRRPTRAIVLLGGADFWSNGLHLHCIEAAASPADESWRNIEAMDDLCAAILTTTDRMTIAAMRGNAAAGGVFLALAADQVWAHPGVVLNPHYKNMGNLYGSEYWTYTLPKRVGSDAAAAIMARRLPLGAPEAERLALIDECVDVEPQAFIGAIEARAGELVSEPGYSERLRDKQRRRLRDEAERALADYRREELERMRLNFYGFDPSYHVARYKFVYRQPHAWTPLYLARHRQLARRATA